MAREVRRLTIDVDKRTFEIAVEELAAAGAKHRRAAETYADEVAGRKAADPSIDVRTDAVQVLRVLGDAGALDRLADELGYAWKAGERIPEPPEPTGADAPPAPPAPADPGEPDAGGPQVVDGGASADPDVAAAAAILGGQPPPPGNAPGFPSSLDDGIEAPVDPTLLDPDAAGAGEEA